MYVAIVTTLSIFDARYIGPHTWKSYGEEPSPGCAGESSIKSKSTELTLSTEHTMHVHRQSVRRIGSVQLASKGVKKVDEALQCIAFSIRLALALRRTDSFPPNKTMFVFTCPSVLFVSFGNSASRLYPERPVCTSLATADTMKSIAAAGLYIKRLMPSSQ